MRHLLLLFLLCAGFQSILGQGTGTVDLFLIPADQAEVTIDGVPVEQPAMLELDAGMHVLNARAKLFLPLDTQFQVLADTTVVLRLRQRIDPNWVSYQTDFRRYQWKRISHITTKVLPYAVVLAYGGLSLYPRLQDQSNDIRATAIQNAAQEAENAKAQFEQAVTVQGLMAAEEAYKTWILIHNALIEKEDQNRRAFVNQSIGFGGLLAATIITDLLVKAPTKPDPYKPSFSWAPYQNTDSFGFWARLQF